MTYDLVLPCYNPSKNWHQNIVEWWGRIHHIDSSIHFKLILVNDGSTNISSHQIEFLKEHIPTMDYVWHKQNKGKGFAIREGAKSSKNDYLIFTDIDFPYTLQSFKDVMLSLKSGSDVVLGFREDDYYVKVPIIRKLISKVFRFFLETVLKWPITDTQCGLKGFSKEGKSLLLTTTIDRYLFDVEVIKKAVEQKDLKINPVTVSLRDGIEFSSLSPKILLREIGNLFKVFAPTKNQ
ncbi:MAG: glycosyltransferase family 2 protein [Cyclobacteriaceae bacterium]